MDISWNRRVTSFCLSWNISPCLISYYRLLSLIRDHFSTAGNGWKILKERYYIRNILLKCVDITFSTEMKKKILLQESFWCHNIHYFSREILDDAVHGVSGLQVGALEIFL